MACTPLTADTTLHTADTALLTADMTEICDEAPAAPEPPAPGIDVDVEVWTGGRIRQRRQRADYVLLLLS